MIDVQTLTEESKRFYAQALLRALTPTLFFIPELTPEQRARMAAREEAKRAEWEARPDWEKAWRVGAGLGLDEDPGARFAMYKDDDCDRDDW